MIGVFVTDRCEAHTLNYGKIEGRLRARALQLTQIMIGFTAARAMHGMHSCICVPYIELRALAIKNYIYMNLERVPHHFTMFSRYRTRNWLIIYFELMTISSVSRIDSVTVKYWHGAHCWLLPASELHISVTTCSD
jgi:hypothetical protein